MSTTQESSASESSQIIVTGQVKWFNIKAGYGFITLVDGEQKGKDIFVHYSSLKVVNSQYRYLVQGEYVEFHLVKLDGEKYEFHAVDVTGIKGGPIMCEARRASLNSREEGEPIPRSSRREEGGDEPRRIARRPRDNAPSSSSEEPGFEKVVKKRQPRAKAQTA
jgi:protein lin-28